MNEHVSRVLVRCVYGKKPDDFVFTREGGSPVKDFRGGMVERMYPCGAGSIPVPWLSTDSNDRPKMLPVQLE